MSNTLNTSGSARLKGLVKSMSVFVAYMARSRLLKVISAIIGITAAGLSILNSSDSEEHANYVIEIVQNDLLIAGLEVVCLDELNNKVQVTDATGTVYLPASCEGKMIRVSDPMTHRILDTRQLGTAKMIRIPVDLPK